MAAVLLGALHTQDVDGTRQARNGAQGNEDTLSQATIPTITIIRAGGRRATNSRELHAESTRSQAADNAWQDPH